MNQSLAVWSAEAVNNRRHCDQHMSSTSPVCPVSDSSGLSDSSGGRPEAMPAVAEPAELKEAAGGGPSPAGPLDEDCRWWCGAVAAGAERAKASPSRAVEMSLGLFAVTWATCVRGVAGVRRAPRVLARGAA